MGRQSRLRQNLWQACFGKCYYCNQETSLDAKDNDPKLATIDHIVPKSKGGKGLHDNKVIACLQCNQTKSNKRLDDYICKNPHPTLEVIEQYIAREGKCWFCEKHTQLWWEHATRHKAVLTHGKLSCLDCFRKYNKVSLYEAVYGPGSYYHDSVR